MEEATLRVLFVTVDYPKLILSIVNVVKRDARGSE
jgi:hypothetical protein